MDVDGECQKSNFQHFSHIKEDLYHSAALCDFVFVRQWAAMSLAHLNCC